MSETRIEKYQTYRQNLTGRKESTTKKVEFTSTRVQVTTGTGTLPLDQVMDTMAQDTQEASYMLKKRKAAMAKKIFLAIVVGLITIGIIVFAIIAFGGN